MRWASDYPDLARPDWPRPIHSPCSVRRCPQSRLARLADGRQAVRGCRCGYLRVATALRAPRGARQSGAHGSVRCHRADATPDPRQALAADFAWFLRPGRRRLPPSWNSASSSMAVRLPPPDSACHRSHRMGALRWRGARYFEGVDRRTRRGPAGSAGARRLARPRRRLREHAQPGAAVGSGGRGRRGRSLCHRGASSLRRGPSLPRPASRRDRPGDGCRSRAS